MLEYVKLTGTHTHDKILKLETLGLNLLGSHTFQTGKLTL